MGVHLDHIHVHVLALGDFVPRDYISYIDNAIFIAFISVVVEENMLSVVICCIQHQKFGSTVRKIRRFPTWIVFRYGNRAILLEGFKVHLMLDEMVSSDIYFLRVVDHIDMAEVLGRIALMLAIDLDHFVDCITSAIQGHSLAWITDSVVFLILASVHLDK
jgi:hypothetical protein